MRFFSSSANFFFIFSSEGHQFSFYLEVRLVQKGLIGTSGKYFFLSKSSTYFFIYFPSSIIFKEKVKWDIKRKTYKIWIFFCSTFFFFPSTPYSWNNFSSKTHFMKWSIQAFQLQMLLKRQYFLEIKVMDMLKSEHFPLQKKKILIHSFFLLSNKFVQKFTLFAPRVVIH